MLRGVIPTDGSPGRSDLSLSEQLRQRAAMGGEKERAELAAFEALFARWIADALVARLREEAVDVWTWLARETSKDERSGGCRWSRLPYEHYAHGIFSAIPSHSAVTRLRYSPR